jgi:hypothetical protein
VKEVAMNIGEIEREVIVVPVETPEELPVAEPVEPEKVPA